jgi:hypothetical protein
MAAKATAIEDEQKKKDNKCKRIFKRNYTTIDMFGEEVKLTFDGEEMFKTNIGATVSLVLIIILTGFLG